MASWENDPIVSPKGKPAVVSATPWKDDPIKGAPDGTSPDVVSAAQGALRNQTLNSVPLLGPLANAAMGAVDTLGNPGVTPEQEASGEWRRGSLAPVIVGPGGQMRPAWPQMALDAAEAFQTPQQILSGEKPFDPRVSWKEQDPATLDAAAVMAGAAGSELPLAARNMVRTTPRNLVDAQGRPMPKMVADELERANIAPQRLSGEIDALGPAGILGDLSPRLQARVGAVATTPGPGQDMIVQALMARQKGANSRIKGAIGETFGDEPIPSRVRAEIDAARVQANEAYEPVFAEKALSGATPAEAAFDVRPIVDAIDNRVADFVGGTRTKVQAVRDMLFNPETGQPVTDPQTVLAVRHELDGMIEELNAPGSNRTTRAALVELRKAIDEDMATQVPGIKWADAARAEVAAQSEAFDLGRDVLRNGAEPIHPVDLADAKTAMEGPKGTAVGPRAEPSIVPQRLSEGTLSKIYEVVGTTANDRVALKALLKGEGSWNREKLVTVFGEAKAQKLIDLLDAEATMAQTENLAFGNSKTEVVRSAKEGIEPSQRDPGFVRSAANFKFGDAAVSVADALLGGTIKTARQKRNAAIAEALLSGRGWRPKAATASNGSLAPAGNFAVLEAMVDKARKEKR